MKKKLFSNIRFVSKITTKNYIDTLFSAYCITSIVVTTVMTIVNIITHELELGVSTAVLSLSSLIIFTIHKTVKQAKSVNAWIFPIIHTLIFTWFYISGNPQGFSLVWGAMLPLGMYLLFPFWPATYATLGMGVSTVFFFWTPLGRSLLLYDYQQVWLTRFPLFYFAVWVMSALGGIVRSEALRQYDFACNHDQLTRVYNRYGFTQNITDEVDNSKGETVSFLIADIDHFKHINDTYGHFTGDKVLVYVAQTLQRQLGCEVCRWGGEEFAALSLAEPFTQARLDAVCKYFVENTEMFDGEPIPVTLSIGAITIPKAFYRKPDILGKLADHNLYRAKETGRRQAITSVVTDAKEYDYLMSLQEQSKK